MSCSPIFCGLKTDNLSITVRIWNAIVLQEVLADALGYRHYSTKFDQGKEMGKRKIKHVCKMKKHVLEYTVTMDIVVQEDVFYGLQINL